ncbi:MAG: hypothetical protein JSW41_02920 [Candidatus Aenigmatarchaeota archaeon]|nr:MAG: hypothetical protein JSW41_02920 [Candidatus Aenigmarchaeota archaeon]
MKVKVKGKEVTVGRIADLPQEKIIRVFVPGVPKIVFKGKEYGTGILTKTSAKFTAAVQKKIDELT